MKKDNKISEIEQYYPKKIYLNVSLDSSVGRARD